MNKDLFNNMSYMGNYRVFCFSDIVLSKFKKIQECIQYNIGDFIPTVGYNYMYSSNLLIVDYLNKVVHLVIRNKYCEVIKVHENRLELFEYSFLPKLMFGNYKFEVIDIYGNFLNVKDISDLIMCVMSYPIIEMSFIENNYTNLINDDDKNKELLINSIDYLSSDNHVYINGVYKPDTGNDMLSLTLINNLKNSVSQDLKKSFENTWFSCNTNLILINEFLKNIRLLYLAVENNIQIPFVYYNNDNKYVTHTGKISNYLKSFVLNNEEETINLVLDNIFRNIEFEEDYIDFIISTISICIDTLN